MKKIFGKAVALATMTAALAVLSSCGEKEVVQSDEKVLNLYNWTYYTPDSVIKKFEDEFGVKVNVDSYTTNEEMYAKIKAGGGKGYDIIVPSQDYVSIMIEQDMLREIDHEKFTNAKNINPKVLEKATYDPEMKYSVPYYFGAAGISVNNTKVQNYEKSWNIFARTDLKGHMSMMDDMREVLGDALACMNLSVNTVDDEKLKDAAKIVKENWKPNLVKFDSEGFGKSFRDGDFWVCQGYAEAIFGEVPEERWNEIDFFIPSDGGPSYLDSMCILKDSTHYAIANDFINFIHRPEIYAEFLDAFRFPCYVNTEAAQYMKTTPMYNASEMDNCELKEDIGEDLDKFNELWQDIRFN
ncbi:MAG: extracellular solute-binding protein [Treponema sp.]|nr:extracellular solute-binding protein [Treponema sp.]